MVCGEGVATTLCDEGVATTLCGEGVATTPARGRRSYPLGSAGCPAFRLIIQSKTWMTAINGFLGPAANRARRTFWEKLASGSQGTGNGQSSGWSGIAA